MIIAIAYKYIFLFLVTLLTLIAYSKYSRKKGSYCFETSRNNTAINILVVLLIIFIGLRPQSGVFVDMMNYVQFYNISYGLPFNFDLKVENILYDNLFAYLASKRIDISVFFILNSIIYFGASYVGIKRLFPAHKLVAYLTFLAAFSTFSYATNGIKAGAAASLFILAISYYNKLAICIPLMITTIGIHHSMQLPITAFLLTLFIKNPKYYFYGWFLCLLLAATRVSFFQELFAGYTNDKGSSYLTSTGEDWGGKSGFRFDFVLYSAMPVIIGYIAIFKKKIKSKTYSFLLCTYLTTNSVWMLCMYANYTNRIAYLSWFLYPIVLIFPYLNEGFGENRYKIFAKVLLLHLSFTLFMTLLY